MFQLKFYAQDDYKALVATGYYKGEALSEKTIATW